METFNEREREEMKKALTDKAQMLKTMAHPVRLCLLVKLMQDGSCNVGGLQDCLDVAQPTISQHLGKLRAAGIVTAQRNGKEMIYRIGEPSIRAILHAILNEK